MTDEQPTAGRRSISTRRRVLMAVVTMLLILGCLTVLPYLGLRGGELVGTGVTLAGILGTVAGMFIFENRENRDISASRERVREAERDVEGALLGTSMATLSGPRRARRVPVPAAGDADERQREEDAAAREERRDLALSRLWKLTQARLDLYHTIATTQARRSFVSAQFAMVAGFVMLTAFVVLALNVSSTSGAIVAGGLGAVSAALAGFISKTFVRSQQTAAEHLKAYFDQPLEFSRYLAAERLLADANLSDEQRAEVVAALVQTVAAGPAGPALVDTRALLEQVLPGVPGQR